jgi:hypothetical protein
MVAAACHSAGKDAPAPSTAPTIHVDRRVELMSILQRLAGAQELAGTPSTKYVADVDAHFGPLRDHPAVVRTKQLRDQFGIAFDAPMWLAVMLDDHYFLTGPPGDPRWASADADGYMTTVRDFVKASGFDAFEDAHAAYIGKVEDRIRAAISKEDPTSWFDAFFGKRPGIGLAIVPGLLTGQHNFGPSSPTSLYSILGITHVDFDELPVVDDDTIELLVHETAHGYVNPVFARHHQELAQAGQRLFAEVAEPMRRQAYATWEIMLNEQAVRAVTSLYLRERRNQAAGDAAIAREEARGFKWTRPLVELYASYEKQRQQYADFEALMPKIVGMFASQP